jgi:mono/diheme cytochrome c family protein
MNMRHRRRLRSSLSACRHVPVIAALLCGTVVGASAQSSAQPAAQQAPSVKPEQPLSADDVSWLFPAPTKASDLANLIAIGDLTAPDPQDASKRERIWSEAAFQQFLAISASPTAAAGSDHITLPAEVKTIDAWHIAGVRFDAGAPGLSDEIIREYGQSPQIRLVLQPVVKNADDSVTPLDMTAHLVFNFTSGAQPPLKSGCFPRLVPDLAAFKEIVADVAALRSKLRDGQLGDNKIVTAAKALGVHPGLIDQTTRSNVRSEMKAILERHLSSQRLAAMAIMGLPDNAPEPWIFLSMQFVPPETVPQLPNGGFVPVHGPVLDGKQFAQLLEPAGSSPRVVPQPHTNNLAPITCLNAAVSADALPINDRKGVATADLPADPARTAADKAKVLTVLNTIADPTKSHFFNTDCVSCHTETRRALELLQPRDVPKISAAPLPNGPWNVRNFGWSPLVEGDAAGSVSRRTAAETKAVVDFINAKLLVK